MATETAKLRHPGENEILALARHLEAGYYRRRGLVDHVQQWLDHYAVHGTAHVSHGTDKKLSHWLSSMRLRVRRDESFYIAPLLKLMGVDEKYMIAPSGLVAKSVEGASTPLLTVDAALRKAILDLKPDGLVPEEGTDILVTIWWARLWEWKAFKKASPRRKLPPGLDGFVKIQPTLKAAGILEPLQLEFLRELEG